MFLVVVCLTLLFIYIFNKLWAFKNNDYWAERGVPAPKRNLIFGNTGETILMTKSFGQVTTDIYNQFDNAPYVGLYNMHSPYILIREPSLIRDVLIKDFNHFHDNLMEINEEADPLTSQHLFALRGEKWKDTRDQVTPVYTAAKVKTVLPNIEIVAKRMVDYIRTNNSQPLEAKNVSTRFTTDNVFSIMFSVDAASFDDNRAEYWKMIRSVFTPSVSLSIRIALTIFLPSVAGLLKIGFLPRKLSAVLLKQAAETRERRQKNNVVLDDFFGSLTELRQKKTGLKFSDTDIAGQSAIFITDGLETSAITLSFMLYELAANPNIQERLYQEIASVLESHGDLVSFEAIKEMSYLDCVYNEALRMHPPALFLLKVCTEDYTLRHPNAKQAELTIEKGTALVVPAYALHMDPKLFPNPNVFDPERFAPENRSNVIRGSFLPFGDGPRNCIGQKFAVAQIKVGVIHILKNFKIEIDEKMKTPLEIDPLYFMMAVKGGLWVKFVKRGV